MKKIDRKPARTTLDNLPRTLESEELLLVAGGEPIHDCVTASGSTCDGDDCGAIPVGSHCGG